ncbi:hypothetical protein SADUNF_Sadunf10G0137700 [Salix dunnii]|uniref:Dicer-like 2 n=1 Tax=Salix dunnii TaxID=1413687 RepID=A0A835MR28_9ROSI|nr:hypothetical protein SADUNF_Sadunf10G0137700 [Salix dunnii]
MEPVSVDIDKTQQPPADPLPFARSYQLEALEKALKQNTIVFLETGSGKTLIATMLLRSYAHLLRKPSRYIAVFLVPEVLLARQQAGVVRMHTDMNVGVYWGDMGVDFWHAATWKQEILEHEVLVMTHQIFLNGLRQGYFKLDLIKVLIFDECHHARGNHPYACIMTEFFHRELGSGHHDLPRIFGMTASLIKSKGANSESYYRQQICLLENIMNSKVHTCDSETVLAKFIPFSTPKFLFYEHMKIPDSVYACLEKELGNLKAKHELFLEKLDLSERAAESVCSKISKVHSALMFCLGELGVWLALQAAQFLSHSDSDSDFIAWGRVDVAGETTVKKFCWDASLVISNFFSAGTFSNLAREFVEIITGDSLLTFLVFLFLYCIVYRLECCIGDNTEADVGAGHITEKVLCLIKSLLLYRDLKDMRCIVFVERVITAVVLESLLRELLPKHSGWKTKYIAGNNSGLQSQTRQMQNEIMEEFRKGMVNIIVATSILEEGLDVQSCNLVIRFDPPASVSSFIQSRGRARMQNSDYLLMVNREDLTTHARLENYLSSSDIMRRESLSHTSTPCLALQNEDEFYCVEGTGAVVTLSSSISLICFYCSHLPSDGYFKPAHKYIIDKEMMNCTLLLPKSSPIQDICVEGNIKILKQKACLEACKQLHLIGALTDNLVPDIVEEQAVVQEVGNERYDDDQPIYLPPELVSQGPQDLKTKYHCYLIELNQKFDYDVPVHDIVLVMKTELESDVLSSMGFELEVERGLLAVNLRYIGDIYLDQVPVLLCRRFQITLFKVLIDRDVNKLEELLKGLELGTGVVDYFLLPATGSRSQPFIDWAPISSVLFSCKYEDHFNCSWKENAHVVHTKGGPVCVCMLQNSLVCTPHNGSLYCITGVSEDLNGRSLFKQKDGVPTTYKEYYAKRHSIQLCFDQEPLLKGRHIFPAQNFLFRCRKQKEKGLVFLSCLAMDYLPLPLGHEYCDTTIENFQPFLTLYSYTFIPSLMHRLESLLVAVNLKKMLSDHCMQIVDIPVMKVLEAITTKKCQEKFDLESLETLGDSFLKYAASQHLFKLHQNHHEGLLTLNKVKIISNAALCRRGCDRKLPGFIRSESFNPKLWMVPGDKFGGDFLSEEPLSECRKVYIRGRRKVRSKKVADVVEALIGAYLGTGGEVQALLFMDWIGIKVDFTIAPYERNFQLQAEKFVNVRDLESLLNYSFHDPSLLVEALTHGSYMLPEIPRCYQRLEFLGDAVLDYLVTMHLYKEYPGMSPGLLTDMRSASVNNDCYAQSAIKGGLHKHILYNSQALHKHIVDTAEIFQKTSLGSTFGWESETSFPKVSTKHIKVKYVCCKALWFCTFSYIVNSVIRALILAPWKVSDMEELRLPVFANFVQLCNMQLIIHGQSEFSTITVLGDVIESLAGAILVDSGYNKEIVFQSIRPLLEPLITPETVRLHPARELTELCQKQSFDYKKSVSHNGRIASFTIVVEANGEIFKHTATAADKKTAKKLASREVLKSLKLVASSSNTSKID